VRVVRTKGEVDKERGPREVSRSRNEGRKTKQGRFKEGRRTVAKEVKQSPQFGKATNATGGVRRLWENQVCRLRQQRERDKTGGKKKKGRGGTNQKKKPSISEH